MFSQETFKCAAELITGKRTTKPVHSLIHHIVFDDKELAPPDKDDLKNFEKIMKQMVQARPHQLGDVKVLSGRIDPSHLVNALEARKDEDTTWERIWADRDLMAQIYSNRTPTSFEQEDAQYHPHANAVIINNRSPGALIHELGHGVDMSRRPGESKAKRNLRWKFKPLLWEEYDAWSKGRKTYREGFAQDADKESKKDPEALNKNLEQYLKNMESVHGRKYPAFGTYAGGTAGAVTGGLAGGIGGALLAENTGANVHFRYGRRGGFGNLIGLGMLLGATLGGVGGAIAGGSAGKAYANVGKDKVRDKEIQKLVNTLSEPEAKALILQAAHAPKEKKQ